MVLHFVVLPFLTGAIVTTIVLYLYDEYKTRKAIRKHMQRK